MTDQLPHPPEGTSVRSWSLEAIRDDLRAAAFPKLDRERMAEVGRCTGASVERHRAGETLFRVGDRDFKFFVIVSGEVEIVDPCADPPSTIAVQGPGEFTGDVSHLTGSPTIVNAIARTDCETYEVSADGLRHLIDRCPALSDIILQAFIARRQLLRDSGAFKGIRVMGSHYSPDTLRIREFLARNRVPFTWLDLEDDAEVDRLLKRFGLGISDTPVVMWGTKVVLRNPTNRALADALGLHRAIEHEVYDLAVVGSGPAGLAAAVYGASEGLRTVVLERTAPGGQAASSMRIENYLGFPTGVTGADFAERAVVQANKFGASISIPASVTGLTFEATYLLIHLDDGGSLATKSLIIASGVEYRRLPVEGRERFEGCGVYYAATPNELALCRDSDVIVVGGGNSAGQAAVFLAKGVHRVYLVIRGDSLYKDMSAYLARRIESTENIEVLLHTTVGGLLGNGCLHSVQLSDQQTGERRSIQTPALFSFIGAAPRTDWLPAEIERDAKGFVRTGPTLAQSPHWEGKHRQPFLLETSHTGIFAGGDVRSGSIKRVASAVGEGAMAVQFVHEYLKES